MQPLKLHANPAPGSEPAEDLADVKATPAKSVGAKLAPLLLSAADLAELLRVSTATIWRLRAAGKLPRPSAALGRQLVRWDYAEVVAWQRAGMPELKAWEAMGSGRGNGRK